MNKKINKKGAALVEYAIVLSCICAVGLSFTGDGGLMGTMKGLFNKVNSTINLILGSNDFSEAVLKDKLVWLKDLGYKTYQYGQEGHATLGSYFLKDERFDDTTYNASVSNSSTFADQYLSKIDFGDVPLESWRYISEGAFTHDNYAYLIWSNTNWKNGDFHEVETSKTACMYARINRDDNTVQYGVAYANPLHVHSENGTLHGGETGKGGMVDLSSGGSSNLKIDHTWFGDNMNAYLAADSPYFTSDYSTAVGIYKQLQARSQSK